jgi:hypothetical protein
LESSAIVPEKTWGIFHHSTEMTVTTQDGGEYPDDITPEAFFLLNLLLFLKHYWRMLSAIALLAILIWVFVRSRQGLIQRPFWLRKVIAKNKQSSQNGQKAVDEKPLEKKP